jgi:hypothetical protein
VRDRVDEGDDVAAHAVADALDGIASEHLQGFGFDLLGFSGFDVSLQGFSSSAAIDAAGHMPHFVGCSGDDTANGGDTR